MLSDSILLEPIKLTCKVYESMLGTYLKFKGVKND